jgi:hypothetical protein
VEHVTLTDPLDIDRRVAELSLLKDGWLDGQGSALDPERLRLAGTQFRTRFDPALPPPFLYPTLDGDLRAEWSLDKAEVSVDISLLNLVGRYSALNISSPESTEEILDLTEDESWTTFNEALRRLEPEGTEGFRRRTTVQYCLRQIHPAFVQTDQATSNPFRPTPKQDGKLSIYAGDKITAEKAWSHNTSSLCYYPVAP